MPGAIPAASTYLTITRDKLIEMAYKAIGVLEPGQVLDGEQLNDGVSVLTMIVREVDASQKWRWTIDEAVHVPLVRGVFLYAIDNGLPSNITELMSDLSGRAGERYATRDVEGRTLGRDSGEDAVRDPESRLPDRSSRPLPAGIVRLADAGDGGRTVTNRRALPVYPDAYLEAQQ